MVRPSTVALLAALAAVAAPAVARAATTEVVVTLEAPSLAAAAADTRALTGAGRSAAANPRSAFARGYLDRLDEHQDAVAARIVRTIPGATVRWRYGIVLNGLAVALPDGRLE